MASAATQRLCRRASTTSLGPVPETWGQPRKKCKGLAQHGVLQVCVPTPFLYCDSTLVRGMGCMRAAGHRASGKQFRALHVRLQPAGVSAPPVVHSRDTLAERSKAVAQGAIPKGRGFEPHRCHFYNARITLEGVIASHIFMHPHALCVHAGLCASRRASKQAQIKSPPKWNSL